MGTFADYNPADVVVIVDGNPVQGYADGTFVSIAFDEQQFNKITGADGHTVRAKTNNYAATITLTLIHTAQGNNVLNAFWQADKQDGSGVFPIIVKDIKGGTVWTAQQAWIQQMPAQAFAKTPDTNREWVIACAELVGAIGGNQVLPAA